MLIDIVFDRATYRVLKTLINLDIETYLSARQIAMRANLSVPKVIEILQKLKALKMIETSSTGKREKYAITQIHPLKPILLDAMDLGRKYDKLIVENTLKHIDDIMGEKYYIGMFWAAFSNTTPIDYNPKIYAIYTKQITTILTLNHVEDIYVAEWKKWKPDLNEEIYIGIIKQDKFPPITTSIVHNTKVKTAEIEMGIAQCFTKENKFYPPYASALALIQNLEENRIKVEKLISYADNLSATPIIAAIGKYLETHLDKKLFEELTEKTKKIKGRKKKHAYKWGKNPEIYFKYLDKIVAIDPRPINDAIATVYGH